ncbi:cathepsin L-like proteinase [Capsella rubella]|uniref:cathepsin L-like proteinase n=1 Tax=Capsella rubella TaxID=81985 RepID=UPI000CD4FF45|nr:cathepsin L-like proteinase [Capsella rubella]
MENDGYSYGGGGSKKNKNPPKPAQEIRDLPPGFKNINFDWDGVLGVLREVMDQGNRRTCWTIASTRSLSARLVAEKRFDPPLCLSALHLLVGLIDRVDLTGGLKNLEHLRTFLIDHGTVLEEECNCPQLALEYKNDITKPNPELCTENKKNKHANKFKVQDLIIKDNVNETELIRLLIKGPVAVSMDVHIDFSNFEGDGIYCGPKKGSPKIDEHLILVSGIGTKMPKGIHFWKVQNSAGKIWGNKGYGKILRQISLGRGKPSLFTKIVCPVLLDHYEGQNVRAHA